MIYLAEHPANACYYLGSSLVFSAAFAAIADKRIDTSAMNQTERMAAGLTIALDELNEAKSDNLHYGCRSLCLKQGSLPEDDRWLVVIVAQVRVARG
jgi:hypothetical protein